MMGDTLPQLFWPSVNSTTTLDFPGLVAQAIQAGGNRRADRRAVINTADLHAVEILQQPIVIERQRADEIRRMRELDHADAIVRTRLDELPDDGFHDVDAAHRLAVDLEIQRPASDGHVQRQHHVNAAGLDVR